MGNTRCQMELCSRRWQTADVFLVIFTNYYRRTQPTLHDQHVPRLRTLTELSRSNIHVTSCGHVIHIFLYLFFFHSILLLVPFFFITLFFFSFIIYSEIRDVFLSKLLNLCILFRRRLQNAIII